MSVRDEIVHEFDTSYERRSQIVRATEQDADLLWSWWTSDHVSSNWAIDHRLDRVGSKPFGPRTIAAYLRYCRATGFVEPYLVRESGRPIAYVETYAGASTSLAGRPGIDPTARGVHMLIGDRSLQRRGRAFDIGVSLIDWLFDSFPDMNQMLGDPSVHNEPMQAMCRKIGMREIARVDLGYKTAVVFAVSREEWGRLRRWRAFHRDRRARNTNSRPGRSGSSRTPPTG
jgi:RimJ/RimL family protein N-acetyltransferase